jgi:hypothetical protein
MHYRILLILCIAFACSACSTKKIVLLSKQTATIELPESTKNILIINRYTHEKTKDFVISSDLLYIGGERDLSNTLAEYIAKGIENEGFYQTQLIEEFEMQGAAASTFPDYYSWMEVQMLCYKEQADLLILLEFANVEISRDIFNVSSPAKDDNGNMVELEQWKAVQSGTIEVGLRIYEPQNKNVLDDFFFSDIINVFVFGETRADARSNCPTERDIIMDYARAYAEKYVLRISPTWKPMNRKFYVQGSDAMKKAAKLVLDDKWEAAASIWHEIAKKEKESPKLQSYALYNLALYAEKEGKLKQAIAFAQKSNKLYPNKKAQDYAMVLNARWQVLNDR